MPTKPSSPSINTGHALAPTVAYFLMHEGTGSTTVDLVDNTTVGTFTGGPTWITGPTGAAINLTGSAYLAIPSVGRYNFGLGGRTLAVSLRCPVATTTGYVLGFHDGSSPFAGYGIALGTSVGGRPGYWDGSGTGWSEVGTAINDNAWHQIVVTHDGGNTAPTWYLDGSSLGTSPTVGGSGSNYTGIRAIAANTAGASTFHGDIEWAGVWSTVFSSGDAASLQTDPYQFLTAPAGGVSGGALTQTIIRVRGRR